MARAGGTTEQAYLFGTVFAREAVRRQQRLNIQKIAEQYENRLLSEIRDVRSKATLTTDADIRAQELLAQQNLQLIDQQVRRIKALRPNGRLALEMNPLDPRLPNIPLEDADEIIIPTVPGHIQVAGAVVNETAVRYRPQLTIDRVIAASGVLPSADVEKAFIFRADGTALLPDLADNSGSGFFGARTLSSWFGAENPVKTVALMPGDTVIIPDKQPAETGYSVFVRGLKDWTQILYQLGLGVAAFETLSR